jgi:hypothetical protein
MTDHVRTSYRNHRRATWGLVIAVVVVIAAALVPLATGAPQKFYTVGVPPELCSTPTRQTLTLTLVNQTRSQNLGSANITAPGGIALVNLSGVVTGAGASATISVNVPDQFSTTGNTIRLRNLVLPTNGSTATITVDAVVTSGGTWATIGKQSNNFADSGPGNLFTASGGPFTTSVSQCQQEYVFVPVPGPPVDAERGSAQTVRVQLQSGGVAVPVSGDLTLIALQNGDPAPTGTFSGLGPKGPDTSGASAGKQWTFSVTGNVVGEEYALKVGNTTSSTFSIVNGLCPPNTTDTQHLTSTCSLTSDLNGGILESGVTINNHKLPDSIGIDFEALSEGAEECDPWTRASYTVGTTKYFFPGVSLDFDADAGAGLLKVVYRVRNTDWVRTAASRGNNDIEICAGARHGVNTGQNGSAGVPFIGKYGAARWDEEDGLFWGVLASVPNPSKVKSDPVVCGSGTQDLATGTNGAAETWRTWTICIPYDWDWKNF